MVFLSQYLAVALYGAYLIGKARRYCLIAEFDDRAVRVVDIVLYADDTNERTVRLKVWVREQDIATQDDTPADIEPILFRPYTVEVSCESKLLFLVLIEVTDSLTEQFPLSTLFDRGLALCRVYVRLRKHDIEDDIGIIRFGRKFGVWHCYAVYLLRHDLEASARLVTVGVGRSLCVVLIVHIELTPRKHTCLKNYRHLVIVANQIVVIVQSLRYRVVDDVIEVLRSVNDLDRCHLTDALRVNL